MNFFKKNKDDMYNHYYDENGYFIDTPMSYADDNSYQDSKPNKEKYNKKINNASYNDNSYSDTNYQYNNNYNYNSGVDYDNSDNSNKNYKKATVSIGIFTFLIIYILFCVLGIFNTTFENGYKPQIVNAKIRGERIIYYKCMDEINFLNDADDFKGTEELIDVYDEKNYEERVAILKSTLSDVKDELSSLEAKTYKIKEDEYLKIEMMNMVNDLLTSESATLNTAITFYQQLSGYTTSNYSEITSEEETLLEEYNQYQTKMTNYKKTFEQIKVEDLYIYN